MTATRFQFQRQFASDAASEEPAINEMTGECQEVDVTTHRFPFEQESPVTATQSEPAVNGFDRGDLLADIDRCVGDAIERVIHRYLPREAAKGMRRGIIDQLGDAIVRFDEVQRAVESAAPQKATP